MIEGLWNCAIKAANLYESTRFYVERMGGELRFAGQLFGCNYRFFRMGSSRLLVFDRAPYEAQLGRELPPGFLHFVYEVSDFEGCMAMLRAAGVKWLMEPQEIDIELGRRKIAFFIDPNGIRTEIMQMIEDRSAI